MADEVDGGRSEEAAVARVYGEIASAYEVLYPSLHRYGDRVERFLAEVMKPGMRVLDVGCGPGLHTRGLDASVDVVGLDLAPEMLELAKRSRPSGTWRVHSYLDPVPEDLGTFDVALAIGCLDFCDDLPRVLGHMGRVLKPGARMLFTVLERRSGLEAHEASTRRVRTADTDVTLHLWSAEETARAVEAAGLRVREYVHGPGWELMAEERVMWFGWWDVTRGC
ncbi:methyltransferase domain-containing protein [Corallococcus exiguus]|uniref:class I SAM-dependent methyltransferase n=1 Tax=Corallococcus TaxID=83461 RepID=UPI000EC904F7|nr:MULTISPECIES: class I SAM-dependent methyltransferase [Corallococcus]NPC71390.1 methyltransferase domain-containing protein [Corallococcus exiguus]NRD44489.1 methyltransferase domain-containing protein [Corallococcus exiguus]RKI05445.1 class I SAM-dependent methyltransferase [Corallococcus sp. AB038B]